MELQPIILAGGRGSHMLELTNKLSKPLLPVGNKPLIYYPLNILEKAGFQEVIVITLDSLRSFIEFILKSFKLSSRIVTIRDDSDLDTLDSLKLVKDYIKTDVLVLSCDFLGEISLRKLVDVHKLHDSSITMLLSTHQPQLDLAPGVKSKKKGQLHQKDFIGLCSTDAISHQIMFLLNEADLEDDSLSVRMSVLREFPRIEIHSNLRDTHVYVMKKWVMDYIIHNESKSSLRSELLPYLVHKQFSKSKFQVNKTGNGRLELEGNVSKSTNEDIYDYLYEDEEKNFVYNLSASKSLFSTLGKKILCYAHIHEDGPLINANNIASYVEANRLVAKSESLFCDETSRISASVFLDEKSQIGNDCMVGDRTSIGEKSSIKRSVIGKDCKIGSYVRISNCVIMDHVIVNHGCNLQGSVIAQGAHIGEKSSISDCLIGFNKSISNSSKLTKESIVDVEVMMEFD